MIEVSDELRQALAQHGDEPLPLIDRQTNESYVVVHAGVFARLKKLREDEEDRKLQEGWQKLAFRGIAAAVEDE